MKSVKSAAAAIAMFTLAGAGFAHTASAAPMMMSASDKTMMSSCMGMAHDAMVKDKGCMGMMKKMEMSDSDMKMMMSCKNMSKDMMMKDEKCMSMSKMHPGMMEMPMAK